VLVGGGDPTISRVSNGYYPGAARLSTLAAQVKKALHGRAVTKIVVDASLWSQKDSWDATWKRSEQRTGYLSETSALQVDGDRANPRASVSPRSTNPAQHAGRYFAQALGVPTVTVVSGTAPAGARSLGAVKSPKLSSLVKFMLLTSDGTLAESIARLTSLKAGSDGSAKSLQKVITGALPIAAPSVTIRDGSGLSTRNRVSPKFVTTLLAHLPAAVRAGLSVAGRTGSLASRFTSSPASGHILAKTGWLDTEYSLAGIVHARDGSTERFAFYAIGAHVQPAAKVALDALAARVYVCGARTT
jgi:D-alanyl-D-alanine carboxypeptidase/D-alanyl-D-alanine-endopeptidase (penicillin-binding protein 4)